MIGSLDANQIFSDLEPLGVRVFVLDVRGKDLTTDWTVLSGDERERADRFFRPLDRTAFVAGRAAMRRMLADELGIEPGEVPIVTGEHGRPRLAGGAAASLDFNVTHTTTCVAGAVVRSGARVGIDVESTSVGRNVDLLIQEVTGVRERTRLTELQGLARARAFLACWTRKEAIAKAFGTGVGYPLRNIDLPSEPLDGTVSFQCCDVPAESCRNWMIRTGGGLSEEFVLSIAVHGHEMPFRPTTLSLPSSDCVSGVGIAAPSVAVQAARKCKIPPLRRALMSKFPVSVFERPSDGGRSSPTGRVATQAGQPLARAAAAS